MSLQSKTLKTLPNGGSAQLSCALKTPSQYTVFIR